MIESLKHFLGLCGEPHGLLYSLISIGGVASLLTYFKYKVR